MPNGQGLTGFACAGADPPLRLTVWQERLGFETVSVPRKGPKGGDCNTVAASVGVGEGLSLRKRAASLRLPSYREGGLERGKLRGGLKGREGKRKGKERFRLKSARSATKFWFRKASAQGCCLGPASFFRQKHPPRGV